MTLTVFLSLVVGVLIGIVLYRHFIRAMHLQHGAPASVIDTNSGLPDAAGASERGDLASIPKQNFWR